MVKTLEAEIDTNGNVRLLEPVRLARKRRALLTVLEEEPKPLRAPGLTNRELYDALNLAYADDSDETEKEFLRLANLKASRVLEEWK